MDGLEGVCPECGEHFYGWALCNDRNQWCLKCGCGLEIMLYGEHVGTGYSPFTAEEYKISDSYKAEIRLQEQGEGSSPFSAERN